ncbi:DUF805 domain-containing protein [Secundilactobacillus kimchicus]|nr:DUF805 domain-containing protein [Secundilactobacillus kimchicus]MBT9672483.1 DUF805 domain-containing protein [Secundilactobacillus kimchicus]
MIESYKKYWLNFINFSGTSSRSDYWWPAFINVILGGIIIAIVQSITGHPIVNIYNWRDEGIAVVNNVVVYIVWIADWAVAVRRMHDTDRSGWWILIQLIPIIGWIWFLILLLLPSKQNRWS